ncbi:MAG TPA: hypothetical protein VJ981_07740 [Gammaproteobacteria bacterium]|nr:hypothetical protein [Gammaproteobacteria bacterium]
MGAVLDSVEMGVSERDIATVLEWRFGDGLVYLPKNRPNYLYSIAKKSGFIDADGYLTRKGRILLARYCTV